MSGTILIQSQTAMAEAISAHFNFPCSKQSLQNWQRKKNPPFPPPDRAGRYNQAECFKWFETYILPNGAAGEDEDAKLFKEQLRAEARTKITKDKHAKFDLDREKGKFIPRALAERTIAGALKSYHGFVKRAIEQHAPDSRRDRLIQLGASPELAAMFFEYDLNACRLMIDRIEEECAREAGNGIG